MDGDAAGGAERGTRLLLLEFLFDDPLGRERSEHYPFFLGQARALGVEARWLLSGVYSRATTHMDRHTIDLTAIERDLLLRELADFGPSHILVPDRLGPALEADLRARFPGLRVVCLHDQDASVHTYCPTRFLPEALGLPPSSEDDALPPSLLVDAVEPRYESALVPPPPGVEAPERPHISVIAGPTCTYAARLEGNRFFEGVALGEDMARDGCTFCRKMSGSRYRHATPPIELALRQCEAAAATERRHHARSFLIRGALVSLQIGAFLRAVVARGLPPSRFLFQYRVDELLRVARDVDEVLPLAAGAGHTIFLYNMGIENFSPDENDRLNKRIAPEQVDAAAACVDRWRADFPETFSFGNFGTILYTPWTTLQDLAINYERMRSKRYTGIHLDGLPLATKLQILPETPIAALARRDGAIVEAFDDFRLKDGHCVGHATQAELPWRFLHAEVASFYEVVWRATSEQVEASDALTAEIRALCESRRGRWPQRIDFLWDALAVSRESPAPLDPSVLVERLRARWPESAADAHAAPGRSAGAGPGPLPAPTTASEALLVAHVDALVASLGGLASDAGSPLPGWRAAACRQDFQDGVRGLSVELRLGEARMGLRILPADAACRAYAQAGRLKIVHDGQTSLDTQEKARGVRALCAYLDAALP